MKQVASLRLALWLGLIAVSGAGLHRLVPGLRPDVVETALILASLFVLAGHQELIRLARAVDPLYLAAVLAFVSALLVGQLAVRIWDTYPFTFWHMYAQLHDRDAVFYEYTGIRADGELVSINPAREMPTIACVIKLAHLAEAVRSVSDAPARHRLRQRYENLLRAIARLHNRRAPTPIHALTVTRAVVPFRTYAGEHSIQRETSWEIDVGGQ